MTREEILKANVQLYFSSDHDGKEEGAEWHTSNATAESIYKAMDQYAEQEAIAFAEWIREGEYSPRDMSDKPNWIQAGSKVGWLQPGMSIVHTTNQLYTLYKQTIKP